MHTGRESRSWWWLPEKAHNRWKRARKPTTAENEHERSISVVVRLIVGAVVAATGSLQQLKTTIRACVQQLWGVDWCWNISVGAPFSLFTIFHLLLLSINLNLFFGYTFCDSLWFYPWSPIFYFITYLTVIIPTNHPQLFLPFPTEGKLSLYHLTSVTYKVFLQVNYWTTIG